MESFFIVISVIAWVEARVQGAIDCEELARSTGFSLPHLRAVFRQVMGMPLHRYILGRRVANAAFALVNTQESVADIAVRFGFSCHDTFTRAFRRIAGVTPQEFRKQRRQVARIKLAAGIYGVGII